MLGDGGCGADCYGVDDGVGGMNERPILFNGDMVRAILDGTKTQTRRVVNPQPEHNQVYDYREKRIYDGHTRMWCYKSHIQKDNWQNCSDFMKPFCPYGKVGDQLWVRETHAFHEYSCDHPECGIIERWIEAVRYRADGVNIGAETIDNIDRLISNDSDHMTQKQINETSWRPSIFMPHWASRIQLEITGIRVERVRDITEEDAMDEGVKPVPLGEFDADDFPHRRIAEFSDLWDSINGKTRKGGTDISWSANPWVWVVEFKRIEK